MKAQNQEPFSVHAPAAAPASAASPSAHPAARPPYAHSAGPDPAQWQTLAAHAQGVAALAKAFAEPFNSGAWAEVLGQLHDIGKVRRSFQAYLAAANNLPEADYDGAEHAHSGVGACWAADAWKGPGRLLAYCIAGHHAGLPDWIGGDKPSGALSSRLTQARATLAEPAVRAYLAEHAAAWHLPTAKPFPLTKANLAFWLRMLYACLTDADFLDTERFMDGARAQARGGYPPLVDLAQTFFARLDAKQRAAAPTAVNRVRAEIRAACEAAAEEAPGLFSLTVPTGGGKTLSAMAFALKHALRHGHRRIVYAIPYTSIIEQTADVLRAFLGPEAVLEHHSNLAPECESQQARLAAENWDAPVIVTTTVQLFESLYGCTSSRCRKLHNLAQSVILLDEVQLLPMRLLKPCISAIAELTQNYRATCLLSTATQPTLPGLEGVRELMPAHLRLYERLKRNVWQLPAAPERLSWEAVAEALQRHAQVLCVVNTRRDCRALHALMPPGTIHLSASMCGEHRSQTIARIKAALARGEAVRVISTQLVEAGVDIDFPVVYRAFTGLASIAQSAGRCNREGRLSEPGQVVVFYPPKPSPQGELRWSEDAMASLLQVPDRPALDDPALFPRYFAQLQAKAHQMGEAVLEALTRDAGVAQINFRAAANAFRMIDDGSVAVMVRYGEGEALIKRLRDEGPSRALLRRLQRYTVNVPKGLLPKLLDEGMVEEPVRGFYAQSAHESLYSEDFGFDLFREGLAVEDCVC